MFNIIESQSEVTVSEKSPLTYDLLLVYLFIHEAANTIQHNTARHQRPVGTRAFLTIYCNDWILEKVIWPSGCHMACKEIAFVPTALLKSSDPLRPGKQ